MCGSAVTNEDSRNVNRLHYKGRKECPQKDIEMRNYYKIRYTIRGDTGKIRSVILSCINEDSALANFKVAFNGQSPSIVSIKWVPKPGSMVASVLASMAETPTAEPELAVKLEPDSERGVWAPSRRSAA